MEYATCLCDVGASGDTSASVQLHAPPRSGRRVDPRQLKLPSKMSLSSALPSIRLAATQHLSTNLPPSSSPLGPQSLSLTIARRDWSPAVRTAAFQTLETLTSPHTPLPAPVVATLTSSLRDEPHAPARAHAYRAAAAACAPLETVLAALALETDARVRVAGLEAVAAQLRRAPRAVSRCALVSALSRDDAPFSQAADADALLAAGEFAGVLADAVEDPDEGVCCAALRLVTEILGMEGYEGGREVGEIAQRLSAGALRGSGGRGDVRVCALGVPEAVRGWVDVDLVTARALTRVVVGLEREKDWFSLHSVSRILSTRPVADYKGFCEVLEAVDVRMLGTRAAQVDIAARGEDGAGVLEEASLLVMMKRDLARVNESWAHVCDLMRDDLDRLVPCWSG